VSGAAELPPYVALVLDLVERIPPGHVLAYGDVAACLGAGGPRQVGRVLALYGEAVPWWRVTRADGSAPVTHLREARRHWRAEGVPLRPDGARVDMALARWDPTR
jgi:alkylated DNA nucleotide flippase Atl1